MTVPITALKLSDIQTEFTGGVNPISLSEYYRGGATGYVPSTTATSATDGTPISTSSTIRMGMFRGTSKTFTFTATISSNTANYNLRTAAIAAGWNGTSALNATVTVNSGIYLYGTTTAGYGFDTGSIPTGSTLTLVNNGLIVGAGGAGGAGAQVPNIVANSFVAAVAGSAGGAGLRAQFAISITNNGTVAGGGGGGGGGGAEKRSYTYSSGTGKTISTDYYTAPGGGGGGGRGGIGVSTGGAGSTGAGGTTGQNLAAGTGTTGTLAAVGAGGFASNATGICAGGAGGTGGALGSGGATGGAPATSSAAFYNLGFVNGAAGGAAGAATSGNSNITWVVTGTRLGTLG
jgi:hypothetical protein